jgi:hypothetical protein
MQPVIYLDIDGVVATNRCAVARCRPREDDDPIAWGILKRICNETGAQIAVSSSYRLVRRDDCIALLEKYGLTPFLHHDLFTGNLNSRSAEIEAHRATHGISRFIIIDDERNDFTPEQLKLLVHTDMQFGLGVYDYDRALRLLGVDRPGRDHPAGEPYQAPRLTLANHARQAADAIAAGNLSEASRLLELIADHPLAQ